MSDYDKQAQDFLTRNGIKFRATLSDSKRAPWDDGDKDRQTTTVNTLFRQRGETGAAIVNNR